MLRVFKRDRITSTHQHATTAVVLLGALSCGATQASPAAVFTKPTTARPDSAQTAVVAPAAGRLESPRQQHPADYRIGPNDVLEIGVFQAPELNASVRVSDAGEISVALLGQIRASGLTAEQLESQIEDLFRAGYIRDPEVTVQVTELHSRPVSVLGAVNKPGVFQLRGKHTLLEILSLAGGLSEDAGTTATIVRQGADSLVSTNTTTIQVPLGDPTGPTRALADVAIYPGDIVNVQTAGIVYVVGAVNKPGSFVMRGNHALTVLRAIAVAEGVTPTAAKGDAVILRTNEAGERIGVAVDLDAIFARQREDLALQPSDVLFVPVSGGKAVARAAIEALARIVTFRGVIP